MSQSVAAAENKEDEKYVLPVCRTEVLFPMTFDAETFKESVFPDAHNWTARIRQKQTKGPYPYLPFLVNRFVNRLVNSFVLVRLCYTIGL